MGLSGALVQVMPLIRFARAHPEQTLILDGKSFHEARLGGRYYAPFFRAAPQNLVLPEDWNRYCHRVVQPIRLLIAGSRDYQDEATLSRYLHRICARLDRTNMAVISGKAAGADSLGEQWARAHNLPVIEFPALWTDDQAPRARIRTGPRGSYNPGAGHDRNAWMAACATHAVLFPSDPDNFSRGTHGMKSLLESLGIPLRVCKSPARQKT